MLTTSVEQEIVGGNISGDLYELPAGMIGIAAGFEYREEYSRSEFDALQQAGLNAGNAIPATEGSFDVTEYYVEANVPIFETLSMNAAVRLSDYSTVGNTESWNVGLDWTVTDSLRLRATRARSTRAPNIDELFLPPSQTFTSGLNDPCQGIAACGGGAAGGLGTEGVDLTMTYSADIGPGAFRTRLAYTYLIDAYTIPLPGADKDNSAGEISESEHKANWNFGYTVNDFDFNWSITYIGSADFDDQFLSGFDLPAGYIGIGSVTYHDVQASYHFSDSIELYAGASNLFDKEPPKILTGVLRTDTETDAGTYDPIGQTFYVGFRSKF